MVRLLGLLGFKWTYLGAGALLLGLGIIAYMGAHPSRPVEIDGTESSYAEITTNDVYTRNELKIVGDDTTYSLDKNSFHPTLPDELYKHGKVKIWIDQGSARIIAITLYDENDENPTKYTTALYDNPQSELSDTQGAGIGASVLGIALIAIFGIWLTVERSRAIASPAARMTAGMSAPVTGVSVGLSADGKWYWDGAAWFPVSDDGRYRWDGAVWQEMGTVYSAKGAPPPPAG